MATIVVSDAKSLVSAIKKAGAGDIIKLAPGQYSAVLIDNMNKAGVTITSLDPGKPAVLTELTVRSSSGLNFTNLDMAVGKDLPFQVKSSSNISFDSVYVHGKINGSSHDDFRGMIVRDSSNVNISNSRFEELTDALSHLNTTGSAFANNSFTTIRDNGIAGGGSSNLKILNNYFASFDHVGDIHPDAIQLWTTNTTKSATDIVISGNTFNRGTGQAIQGIFIRDDVGNLPFANLKITDNTIVGAAYNGIAVTGAKNATISGNTVLAIDGQPSWISLRDSSSVTMTNNFASDYNYINAQYSGAGDVKAGSLSLAAAAKLNNWLSNNLGVVKITDLAHTVSDLLLATTPLIDYIDASGTNLRMASYSFAETLIQGTSGADRLAVKDIGNFRLEGGDGNDILVGGGAGTHRLIGGAGNDSYIVKNATDQVIEAVDGGVDTVQTYIDYTLTANVENGKAMVDGLTLRGNALDNILQGSAGAETLYGGAGNDVLHGLAGNDILHGEDGNDRLYAGEGDDLLYGGAGDDMLYGDAGNDRLEGGDGNDTLEGGSGSDLLIGGAGADKFVFKSADFMGQAPSMDTIMDFNRIEGDKIVLTAIDANTATVADDAFKFLGTGQFTGKAGELRYSVGDGGSYVMGDVNGDGKADFTIFVAGHSSLVQSDFWL